MNTIRNMAGFSPELRGYLGSLQMGLPQIRGKWFYVDPKAGSDTSGGESIEEAVASLKAAYDLCTTNVGDGIVILSSDAATAANTTSYLKQKLTWAKNSITVIGVSAPTMSFQRARVSNKTVTTTSVAVAMAATAKTITRAADSFITDGWEVGMLGKFDASGTNSARTFTVKAVSALVLTVDTGEVLDETSTSHTLTSYCVDLVEVSGSNNTFYGVHFTHGGSQSIELTCLKVTGSRNYFGRVHSAIGLASAATDATRSLWLYACAENVFEKCTFGTDTVDRGANATYDILLSGAVARNRFYECETLRHSSSGTSCLAVYADTTTGGRPTMFVRCIFTSWNTAGGNADQAYMFGSNGACDFVWFVDCTYPGFAALSNDAVAWISGEINSQAAGLMYT